MAFIDRIRACNSYDIERFAGFWAADTHVGWIHVDRLPQLERFGGLFRVADAAVGLDPALRDPDELTEAMAAVIADLAADAANVQAPNGLRIRQETYAVRPEYADPPVMFVDRGAVPFFGIRAYGVHMNGYVRDGDDLKMWIGRRAQDRLVCPGMLDNMVAGGQPADLSLRENLVKECGEEAAIPPALAEQAVAVGAISYCLEAPVGLKPDVMFCYDLELPADFVPRNTDGEIEEFMLLPVDEVAALVRDTEAFKFNCNLVIIDFLIRHGLIPPEHPDYLELLKGLRQ
jgi:hypothetical protein